MSLTTRVSIQWEDNEPKEPTDTLVITSPNKVFVDIRKLRDGAGKSPFDWVFCGSMISGKNGKTRYTHDIDSRRIEGNDPDEQDIGYTTQMENGDERETGQMWNPQTKKRQSFVEIWRPLDVGSSPERVPKGTSDDSEETPRVCVLATVDGQSANGRVVRVGNWMQGVIELLNSNGQSNGNELEKVFACVRSCLKDGEWSALVEYGDHVGKIPRSGFSEMVVGETVTVGGVVWGVIEHNDSPKISDL